MENLSDLELLKLATDKTPEAFDVLFGRHYKGVHALALRMLRNDADAQDATQDIFLAIYRKAHTFNYNSKFTSWVYPIAVNVCLMKIRKEKKSLFCVPLEESVHIEIENKQAQQSAIKTTDLSFIRHELKDRIEKAIHYLPDYYKEVFVLRVLDGASNEEIADKLSINKSLVKTRLLKARYLVRYKLEKYLNAA